MNRANWRRLQEELEKRERQSALIDDLHDGQKRYLFAKDDTGGLANMVCLLSARRFGKTRGFLHLGCDRCLKMPRSRVVLIYQKRKDSRKIAWPILEELAEDYRVGAKPNRLDLAYRFPNGSTIELEGADDPSRHRQFKGQRNDLVLIDEAQDWYSDVQQLVQWLIPGLADRRGRLFMAGTPGPLPEGYFFEVMSEVHPEWSLQRGNPFENPHTAAQMQERLDKLCNKNPEVINEPWVRREFFGEWVVDTRMNVIHIAPVVNYLNQWEKEDGDEFIIMTNWKENSCAMTVGTYNTSRYPHLVFIEAHRMEGQSLTRQKALLMSLMEKYKPHIVHCGPEPSSRTIAKSLREMHGIPITHLGREDRMAEIELMNATTTVGDVKIFNATEPDHPELSPLAEQWANLVWIKDRRTGDQKEGHPRDLHECALYTRRVAHYHLFEPKKPEIVRGSAEWYAEEDKKLRERKARRYAKHRAYN